MISAPFAKNVSLQLRISSKKKDKTDFKRFVEKKKEEGASEEELKKLKMNQGASINYRELIKVEPKENEFLFKVESTGSLSPKKIIYEAFNVLKQKFNEIDKLLIEIEDRDN